VIKLSVQVSYKKQATLGIIGIVILLLAIEVVANVWWVTQINCEFEQNEIFQNFDEVEKRQLCLDFHNLRTSGDELIPDQSTDSITINSLGFRGAEFSEIKPSNTYRTFMVGGSTMFGAGATSDKTTIPGYTQQFLNENNTGINLEVINAGIQGADAKTELKLIKQKLVKFSPDLIIIYDGWNDLRASNTPTKLKENWELLCELGKENNFDVIITLQPIAGFGNKILTKQELKYVEDGVDYNKNPLIESFSTYQDYAKYLQEVKTCTKVIDLRDIFDTEVGPIYWDEAHVSDKGNSIIAKSLSDMIFPIISKNHEFSTFEYKKDVEKTSTIIYDSREITVSVELHPTNELVNKTLRITTHDITNDEIIKNITYFLSISKSNENLLRQYFFAEDGVLSIDIQPNIGSRINVIGEKQYDNDAYVMFGSKYNPKISGANLTSITPLQITGPIFDTEGIYILDIELRTIDSRDNWTFGLSGFNSQVIIGKYTVLEDSREKNKPSFQMEDLLRKIFSYYKTPLLLNEIF
jgi:lysophospholipase L1-like esterase